MILKIFLLVLYFMGPNPTFAIEGMNMRDINSVEIFINNIRERAWSYYNVEKVLMSIDEKTNILKMIFYDLSNILTELNTMSADSQREFSSGDLVYFIDTLEELERKNNYSLNLNLFEKIRKIFYVSQAISMYVEPLQQLGASNMSDQDVLQFCPTKENGRQDVEFEFERQIILQKYKELVQNLEIVIKNIIENKICGLTSSLNQAVSDYFNQIIVAYLKEYVMLYFIDIIDLRCLNLNGAPMLRIRQNESMIELTENIKLTKDFLASFNYSVHNCDADYWSSFTSNEKSYLELEKLSQLIIIAENKLNNEDSCKHNCNLYTMTSRAYHPECSTLSNCQYIHSGYEICPEKNSSSRRYKWFKSDNGYIYGDYHGSCNQKTEIVKSYYRPESANNCDYCLCDCVARTQPKQNVVTAISFRDQVSNIEENKVVVGVRFVKKDYMIHVQIKERKFSSNSSEAHWKQLEDFDYFPKSGKFAHKTVYTAKHFLTKGADYGHSVVMNFDDVIAPEGHVVTGVRFRFAGDSLDNPKYNWGSIQLQIRVTPFDQSKGLVDISKTHWVTGDVPSIYEMNLANSKLPSKSPKNSVDSRQDQYVRFQHSSLIDDAGQSTVPFFDAQDVEGSPEFPLGGVGIIHRGSKGFGGFMAFKIFDINLSKLFKEKK